MKYKQTSVIPIDQKFHNKIKNELVNWEVDTTLSLDLKAIVTFCSIGFMLDDNTYYSDIKAIKPSTKITLNKNNNIISNKKIWDWHYNPKEKSFEYILEEFSNIFEEIITKKSNGKKILLPISGGLDSRTLFVPVKNESSLTLSSYEFEGGIPETETAKALSRLFNIPLFTQKIQRGYLWNKIDEFYNLNNCFSDFIHPRQVDSIHQWQGLGDVILLGHWGDVLFDKQADSQKISYNEQVSKLKKKIIKLDGMELANDLWKHWSIEGSFETYITDRLDQLYRNIDIDHPSARMRAFKSLYWAPRWTSTNLSIFKQAGEIILPYYSNEMCKFICTVPEKYLAGRKIQIEYIKKYCPEAAQIPWQQYYPLNLYQYQRFNSLAYYPVRAISKVKRVLQKKIFNSEKLITRNWELQFLGDNNFIQLRKNLLERNNINKLIPQSIIRKYLDSFQKDPVKYAHSLSVLLTLTVFLDKHYSK